MPVPSLRPFVQQLKPSSSFPGGVLSTTHAVLLFQKACGGRPRAQARRRWGTKEVSRPGRWPVGPRGGCGTTPAAHKPVSSWTTPHLKPDSVLILGNATIAKSCLPGIPASHPLPRGLVTIYCPGGARGLQALGRVRKTALEMRCRWGGLRWPCQEGATRADNPALPPMLRDLSRATEPSVP